MNANVTWHDVSISKPERQRMNGHPSMVIWLTGLSGAGKSTLANALDKTLYDAGVHTYLLDGDNMRLGINSDLGFDEASRKENIRRVADVAKLFVDAGIVVIAATISPRQEDRMLAREKFERREFVEVFVDCPIQTCEKRDPKGLYRKARQGQISNFTGVDAPYERPKNPEVTVQTQHETVEQGVSKILDALRLCGLSVRVSPTRMFP